MFNPPHRKTVLHFTEELNPNYLMSFIEIFKLYNIPSINFAFSYQLSTLKTRERRRKT